MALTYSIDHVSTSVEDVSVEVADKTNMVHQSTGPDPKTGEIVSTYVISNGDNSFPATVVYRSSVQNRASGPIRRISMTFNTWAVRSDSVSGVDTRKPLSGTVSINMPSDITIETADIDDFVGNLFSFLYLSVTTKVRDTAWLGKLLYGIPQVK